MRRSRSRLLAVSLLAIAASGATRPRYGGTLRMETSSAIASLDPAAPGAGAKERAERLIFENLAVFDESGTLQPKLAAGWQHDPDYRRWQIEVRAGIKFQNGQPLTSTVVAESLRRSLTAQNPKIYAESGHVTIETSSPSPNLLAELVKPQNAIVLRSSSGELSGTGPFKVAGRQEGKQISLIANEDYWSGRPYLDGVELMLARAPRDQLLDLELGKADLVEVELDQARRVQQEGERTLSSNPSELLALVFNPGSATAKDERVRKAIALSLDRDSIHSVFLQRQGEPSAALLPQWMTGYAFLFPVGRDVEQARELQLKLPSLTLDYDFADPSARAVAERIAVNAREAGVVMQAVGENLAARSGHGDAYITRVPLRTVDARTALENIAAALPFQAGDETERARNSEQLFRAEGAMLSGYRIIPIAHLPETYGLSARVRNWVVPEEGGWKLDEVWLESGAPAAGSQGHP